MGSFVKSKGGKALVKVEQWRWHHVWFGCGAKPHVLTFLSLDSFLTFPEFRTCIFFFSQLLSCWHSCHTQFFKNCSTGPLPVLFPGWFNKPDSLPFPLCPLLDMDPGKQLSSRPSLDFGYPSLSLSLCQSESSPLFHCCWIPPCLMPYYLLPEITLSFCWNTSYSSVLRKNAFSKCLHVWKCLYSTLVLDW